MKRIYTDGRRRFGLASCGLMLAAALGSGAFAAEETQVFIALQPLSGEPGQVSGKGLPEGAYYVPSTEATVRWGHLPNAEAEPVLTVPSGSTVVFDTVSHEGILDDQGRDPVAYFGKQGVGPEDVLDDARDIAASSIVYDFKADGPHIVTGPVAIEGAAPGDVLKVEVLSLSPRVPYGVISNRHGKGALPGEFPENEGPQEGASAEHPERFANVSVFTPIKQVDGEWYGVVRNKDGQEVRFPINPFLGIMGIAPDTSERVHSVPPGVYGGNLDINELGAGATLYLPIQAEGGLFYVGDPHFVQGDGEVALTALEAPLRGAVRLSVLKEGDEAVPGARKLVSPFAETADFWIPIGLDEDLDEAMKKSVRLAIDFLEDDLDLERATALAYLSAATDFEVSQVVDKTKGIHALIRKAHFPYATGGGNDAQTEQAR